MSRSIGVAGFAFLLAAGLPPGSARSAPSEVRVERDFLAGIVEKLPPCPFEKAGRYRGQVNAFRLAGIDPKARQFLVACRVEGEFNERAIVAGLSDSRRRDGPADSSPSSRAGAGWKAFRFDVKVGINIEPGPDGSPRFRFEVDEVKRRDLEGLAGTVAKVMGREFDRIVTRFADKKSGLLGDKLNAEVLRRVALFREYGVLCGIDYSETQVVLLFDLTRLRLEGVAGYVFPTPQPGMVPLYRWRNPRRGDHFYTTSPSEPDRRLYNGDGIACYVAPGPSSGTVPLYRLRRPRERLYAMAADAERARVAGYLPEGVACYVFPTQAPGTTPLYRFVDPRSGLHFFTTHPHAEFAK